MQLPFASFRENLSAIDCTPKFLVVKKSVTEMFGT